ncbi:MAG: DNA replication protein DnaC [Ruminococcaceae bacterium]|nr:DNA replication protein DnaC [Oscillospiraceae bacterium]
MAYSTEVVRRARERLAQARDDRQRENREHLRIAYEQQPRLKEIDRQLRLTMAKAARAVFAGGNAEELMNQAKEENLALQREREWIIEEQFEDGFLDETPICPICSGTGYVGSTMCDCLAELCRQEQKKELTFLSAGRESFDQFRLDYYFDRPTPAGFIPRVIMEKTYQTCRRYALSFGRQSGNLLFSGNTGLGKTFLSACIARTVADQGFSVVYESAGHLFAALEKARFEANDENRRAAAKYNECDLLIVDDLGTELPGQFVTAALYSLINDRLLENRPTIISTNLSEEELVRRYNPQIASRLRGSYRRVAFVGDDIRLLKNRGGIR